MAVGIVYLLELVDIEHEGREAPARLCLAIGAVEGDVEHTPVAEAGERIGRRHAVLDEEVRLRDGEGETRNLERQHALCEGLQEGADEGRHGNRGEPRKGRLADPFTVEKEIGLRDYDRRAQQQEARNEKRPAYIDAVRRIGEKAARPDVERDHDDIDAHREPQGQDPTIVVEGPRLELCALPHEGVGVRDPVHDDARIKRIVERQAGEGTGHHALLDAGRHQDVRTHQYQGVDRHPDEVALAVGVGRMGLKAGEEDKAQRDDAAGVETHPDAHRHDAPPPRFTPSRPRSR